MAQRTTLKEFESVWPKLQEAILDHARAYKLPEKELNWYKQVCQDRNPIAGDMPRYSHQSS
jgi:farnesyl diphosphate synthase